MTPANPQRSGWGVAAWILGGAAAIGLYLGAGPVLAGYLNQHPGHAFWVGSVGFLIILPGLLWAHGLGVRRARWARAHGVPQAAAAREWTSTRWEGLASAALAVVGAAVAFAAMGLTDGYGDTPGGIVGGAFVGIATLIGVILYRHNALTVQPATQNTMHLLRSPLSVTQVADPQEEEDCRIRVLYEASFRLGPRARVEIDGRAVGELTQGGAIGANVGPGVHLVTVTDTSGARPLRVRVDAERGRVVTVATTMSGAASVFIDDVESTATFRVQASDGSTPMAAAPYRGARRPRTPIATGIAAIRAEEDPAELGEIESQASSARMLVDASAVALPVDTAPEETPDPTSVDALNSPTSSGQRAWTLAVVTLFAGVALGAGALASLLPPGWESLGRAVGDARPIGAIFFSPYLIIVGLPIELRRAKAFAPPRRYPAGLILLAVGAAALGGNLYLLTLADWRRTATSVLFVFTLILILALVPWFFDRRFGVRFRSRRTHFARQRAWRAQPRAVERFAGHARPGWGAIRASVSSTVTADFVFGVDSQSARYEIAESEAVGLYVRAGRQTVEALHGSGLAARFEVEVVNGAVTPVEFGAPARRFLWLVPRRRALHARVGPAEVGPLLLASG